MCAGCFFTDPKVFIAFLCIGAFSLFSCSAGINLAEMMSISAESRSLGLAISTLCIHVFGDVPSPLIVGYLLDKLAPDCSNDLKTDDDGPSETSQTAEVSDECIEQLPKVRLTYLLTASYLIVMVISFFFAWKLAKNNKEKKMAVLRKEDEVLHTHRKFSKESLSDGKPDERESENIW